MLPLWRRPFTWLIVVVGLAFALLPAWSDNVQLRESLLLAAVYITLASNLNIMLGYAGYVNFGNIVFFGLGGYICVYLVSEWQWPLAAAALAGRRCGEPARADLRARHSALARGLFRLGHDRRQRSG